MTIIIKIKLNSIGINPNISLRTRHLRHKRFEREHIMTTFVHQDYPAEHPGVVRAERAFETLRAIVRGFDGARGLAALLLAAVVSAVLVVANQVIDTWSDGHMLAGWIVLWTVAFAGLALFAAPARRAATSLRAGFKAYAERRRQAAADDQYWELALRDARVMAEISRAMGSQDAAVSARYY